MPDPSERAITGGPARVKYIKAAMRGLIRRFWLSGKPPSHLLDPLMGLTRAMRARSLGWTCRPSHFFTRLDARALGGCELSAEQFLKSLRDGLRWACLNNRSIWQAMAQHAGQTSRSRETHIVCQPDGFLLQALGELPMGDEAWLGGLALNTVESALPRGKERALCPRH